MSSAAAPAAVPVLLAADDVRVRLTVEAVLEKSGYLVDSAASAAEAMDKVESGHYALVLCDLGGPSAGADVLRLARAQRYHPATAVLRSASETDVAAGSDERVLVKPIDVERLLTGITDLIGARAARRSR